MSECLTLSQPPLVHAKTIEETITELVPNPDLASHAKSDPCLIAGEIDRFFSQHPNCQALFLPRLEWQALQSDAPWLSLFLGDRLTRSQFYQLPALGIRHTPSDRFPPELIQSVDSAGLHPKRPPTPKGYVYERFDPVSGLHISFRVFDPKTDMARFTKWMNTPRVAHFWEQAWPEERLHEFILERLADPHILPLIGEFDGEPFGYVEAYWASEDRLSPYYDAQPYDRGIHLLVGEESYRGSRHFNTWMRAMTHYLFQDDCRTQRIVLEPRHDNERLFNRIQEVGYTKQFEFNFPHKRSALLMTTRYAFFREQW
ncbi:GNAT family N-acetyltransferase [Enterovibrio sp. 27052020O]|uniref:GNAT family N-acetyltransferase n=1 Tax=Enterovibrio sp. 27052020O TaxID=3241166 RepID=UPI003890BFBE